MKGRVFSGLQSSFFELAQVFTGNDDSLDLGSALVDLQGKKTK